MKAAAVAIARFVWEPPMEPDPAEDEKHADDAGGPIWITNHVHTSNTYQTTVIRRAPTGRHGSCHE